jgi:hypothetical protein
MTALYTYSKARQNLASILDQVTTEGEVRIKRQDGTIFVIRLESRDTSPLDVPGVDLGVSTDEIVAFIREGRESYETG